MMIIKRKGLEAHLSPAKWTDFGGETLIQRMSGDGKDHGYKKMKRRKDEKMELEKAV